MSIKKLNPIPPAPAPAARPVSSTPAKAASTSLSAPAPVAADAFDLTPQSFASRLANFLKPLGSHGVEYAKGEHKSLVGFSGPHEGIKDAYLKALKLFGSENVHEQRSRKTHLIVDFTITAPKLPGFSSSIWPAGVKATNAQDPALLNFRAHDQMSGLLGVARVGSEGKRPDGMCLMHVENYLTTVNYGKIGKRWADDGHRFEYAIDFANFLNTDDRWKHLGLKRLELHNPYEAPPGAIVVVRAGTPGTANPVAGDISIRGHGDAFYNGGMMGYGGPGNFGWGNGHVAGVYVPAGYRA